MNIWTKELKFFLNRLQKLNRCYIGDHNGTCADIEMSDCMWLYVIVVPQLECVWKVHLICSTCMEGGCMVEWLVLVMGTDLKKKKPAEETFNAQPPSYCFSFWTPCTFQHTRAAQSAMWLNLNVSIMEMIFHLVSCQNIAQKYYMFVEIKYFFFVLQYLWDGSADGSDWLQTSSWPVCSAASTSCESTYLALINKAK